MKIKIKITIGSPKGKALVMFDYKKSIHACTMIYSDQESCHLIVLACKLAMDILHLIRTIRDKT